MYRHIRVRKLHTPNADQYEMKLNEIMHGRMPLIRFICCNIPENMSKILTNYFSNMSCLISIVILSKTSLFIDKLQ